MITFEWGVFWNGFIAGMIFAALLFFLTKSE